MTLHVRYTLIVEQPIPTPPKCLHCRGSGLAPGDGRTECGFCDAGNKPTDSGSDATVLLAKELSKFWWKAGLQGHFQFIERTIVDDEDPGYQHPTEMMVGFANDPDPETTAIAGLLSLRNRLS